VPSPTPAQNDRAFPNGEDDPWQLGCNDEEVIEDELTTYPANPPRVRSTMAVGEYWATIGMQTFPGLASVAVRLRACPITSTIAERYFSLARSCLDYTKGASDPATIDKRFMLYANRRVTEEVLAENPELIGPDDLLPKTIGIVTARASGVT
jgi:hypothetical protein